MGLKGIAIPLETIEAILKEAGALEPDAKVIKMQDLPMQNAIFVIAEHETFPELEPLQPIPSEAFIKHPVQVPEKRLEGPAGPVIRRQKASA
jgi:hypothetical protein